MVNANTDSIYNAWSNGVIENIPPETETDLKKAIQAELPTALPAARTWMSGADMPVQDVIVAKENASAVVLSPELEIIRSAILRWVYSGSTEDATHAPIDALIVDPIKNLCLRCGCVVQTNRNGTDSSGATIQNLRPDLLLWLPSGILAFKGEEKAFGIPIQNAREDLRSKMNVFSDTFYGSVPYQLSYACSGSQVEFVAFMRTSTGRPKEIQLTNSVDLSTMNGRSLCVRYAINIARLLVSLHHANPGNVIRLGYTVDTGASYVLIGCDFVTKKTKYFTNDEVIATLYDTILRNRVPHIIYPTKVPIFRVSGLTVNLRPVGFCGARPGTIETCKRASRELLTAIDWLHQNNFVHRDIREANVMQAGGLWYLIDLEWANYCNLDPGEYDPVLKPPEFSLPGFQWTPSADMWQFGMLLMAWNQLDYEGNDLVRLLILETPEQRPSAADALGHAFLRSPNTGEYVPTS